MSQKSIARSRRTRLAAAGAALALSFAVAGPGTALAQETPTPESVVEEAPPADDSTGESGEPSAPTESAAETPDPLVVPNVIVAEGGAAAAPAPSTERPLPQVTGGVVVNADGSVTFNVDVVPQLSDAEKAALTAAE
ncbi:MAG: hypothetical protein WBD41_01365, partial [Rhodococcus sp. (in: high G+C Gram-positive bacteria)]